MQSEIRCEFGKFTIEINENHIIIVEWHGETKKYRLDAVPTREIAACLQWLNEAEMDALQKMIGQHKLDLSIKYAKKWRWIGED